MSKKVNVLGVELSVMKADKAASQSFELLKKKGLEKIFFLSAAGSLYLETYEDALPLVEECALVLPGDAQTEAVASRHPEAATENNEAGKLLKVYIDKLFSRLNRDNMYVFAVMEEDSHLEALRDYVKEAFPDIILEGVVCDTEKEYSPGTVVNEINAIIPDVVLLCLPISDQIMFLKEYTEMMNARLVIATDTLHTALQEETAAIPAWIEFFGLNKFYRWLKNEYKIRDTIINSVFNRRVKDDDLVSQEEEES